jgi:hypothetical protein
LNLSRRFQWALQGYSETQFFYPYGAGLYYDPQYAFLSRSDAIATQTYRGGSIFGIYPFSHYRRVEFSAGLVNYNEAYADAALQQVSDAYLATQGTTRLFRNGSAIPLGAAFVQETTVFREYGPLSGSTMRIGYDVYPKVSTFLSNQTVDVDARKYIRIGENGVFAVRGRGFKSWGEAPNYTFFGGNSEMRGYDYREFIGHKAFYLNAELRFPLITAMATPLGVLGGMRGVFYANLGGAGLAGTPFKVYNQGDETIKYQTSATSFTTFNVTGFHLVDSRASYGVGLETFALGFPVHFDWSYRTMFNKTYEDAVFFGQGGSSTFRKGRLTAWIGYDF